MFIALNVSLFTALLYLFGYYVFAPACSWAFKKVFIDYQPKAMTTVELVGMILGAAVMAPAIMLFIGYITGAFDH